MKAQAPDEPPIRAAHGVERSKRFLETEGVSRAEGERPLTALRFVQGSEWVWDIESEPRMERQRNKRAPIRKIA